MQLVLNNIQMLIFHKIKKTTNQIFPRNLKMDNQKRYSNQKKSTKAKNWQLFMENNRMQCI